MTLWVVLVYELYVGSEMNVLRLSGGGCISAVLCGFFWSVLYTADLNMKAFRHCFRFIVRTAPEAVVFSGLLKIIIRV